MIKILQITKHYFPFLGGIEQTSRDIADVLNHMENIEQKIICFNEDAEGGGKVCHRRQTTHDTIDNVEVIRCSCINKIASQSISLTYNRELKKVFAEFNPSIVIFHYPNPFVACFLLPLINRYKNIKFVLYWHLDITKQKLLGKVFHGQTLALLERADKIVATSPNYIEGSKYLRKYKYKCVDIPSCISVERLEINYNTKEKAEDIRNKYNNKIICFGIGRHVPYKGFTYLIQAAKNLDERFKIYIGGSGPLTDALKAEAKGLKNVEFLGRISDSELAAYFSACDIFCFPSITKNEAFGLALAEGMYFGKPAVTFTIPGSGVNYVNLDGITGIECPNGDSKAYAEALKKLANDSEMREKYGIAARKRVQENFIKEVFADNLMRLIGELIR